MFEIKVFKKILIFNRMFDLGEFWSVEIFFRDNVWCNGFF